MEKLVSSRRDLQRVPDDYVLPSESRPGKEEFPVCQTIPVVDLSRDRVENVRRVFEAAQDFGFFQLTNHGISRELMQDVLEVAEEFFELPVEDKVRVYSEDRSKSVRLYTSLEYDKEKVLCDTLVILLMSTSDFGRRSPLDIELARKYSVEVRKLTMSLLELIAEGLGLEPQFFKQNEISQDQTLILNHYPPCPDPSLTLGLPQHGDVNLITVLLQGEVDGLQVLQDGQWLAVQPLSDAFVVNIGHTLQIISNGTLRSAEHRVLTSRKSRRTTVASFILPSKNSHIKPAEALVDSINQLQYKSVVYKDLLSTYVTDTYERVPPMKRYTV